MRARSDPKTIMRALFSARIFRFMLRALALVMLAYAGGFGFTLAAMVTGYDPNMFATGIAALFGAACGALAFVLVDNRRLRKVRHDLQDRVERLADQNWQFKEHEERAKSFLDAQGDLIVRRDPDGRITFVNDAFCGLAGRSRDALIGSTFHLPVTLQGNTALLPDGTRMQDQNIASPSGPRWIAWREVVVRSTPERGAEMQSVGRDVTDRVLAERALSDARDQAEAANRAKSRFLAMVSHEIRTPLNGIQGMADLLLDTALTPEQMTYARAVKTSGDTLLSLIEEVLDFSKIEAGRLDLEAMPFDLPALVEETVELLAPRAQAKALEIASYLDNTLPQWVVGDAARLRQVLLNLAGNAIKFTEQGGVAVVVETGAAPDQIKFEVRDTGIGIAADQQTRIFLEFEQGEGGAARKFAGTGLGLAISKRIIERMGGEITIESAPGAGATFRVAVPLRRAGNTGRPFVPPDLTGADILVAAASAIEAALVARRLTDWGARASVATDLDSVRALLPTRPWHAVLIDHALGHGPCARLIEDLPASRRIVLITPSVRPELADLRTAGYTGYLVKPVRAASLAARLRADGDGFGPTAESSGLRPAARTGQGAPKRLAILVAEDNDINALLLRALLGKLGHHSVLATDGAAAVAAWQHARANATPFDLVLMDVQMPGSDGLEATRRIRATETEAGSPRTAILALTANALAEERAAALAAGMDAVLTKPLDRERLLDALAAILPAAAAA
jgi:PAS domain S-box-containing protein